MLNAFVSINCKKAYSCCGKFLPCLEHEIEFICMDTKTYCKN